MILFKLIVFASVLCKLSAINPNIRILVRINDSLKTLPTEVRKSVNKRHIPSTCGLVSQETKNDSIRKSRSAKPFEGFFRSVVVNEIFPDPDPPNDLPRAEFVELFNASSLPVTLTNWTISDGVATGVLPEFILPAKSYVILCKKGSESLFESYGMVVTPTTWPTLNNSGDQLLLRSEEETIIDQVTYTQSWYKDNNKKNGGWSLTQINPFYPCSEESNWQASNDAKGGSPGAQNAMFDQNPDLRGPRIIRAIAVDTSLISIIFDEKIAENSLYIGNFSLDPPRIIKKLYYDPKQSNGLKIKLEQKLAPQTLYRLSIKNLTDCSGNLISKDDQILTIVLAELPDSGEIVLNEILFNPRSGGKDFIELYNLSNKYLNLKGLGFLNKIGGSERYPITGLAEGLIINPGQFLVFTENITIVKADYPTSAIENLVLMKKLPIMGDDFGNITLLNQDSTIMDTFDYNQNMHHGLLSDNNGVSLEKISPQHSSSDVNNWHSAASIAGFATPGYKNSVFLNMPNHAAKIHVDPKVFQPNNNGTSDFTTINYQFEKPGYSASVIIYNVNGRPIKEIANHEILGTSGFFQWDGTNSNRELVGPGYYLVYLELFDLNGNVIKMKETVVIAE